MIKSIKFTKDWCSAITRSKYFAVIAELDNGYSAHIEIRFSDHTKSGRYDFRRELNEELIEIGNDLFYEVGGFKVYSHSLRKNYKTVKKALQKCEQFKIDLYDEAMKRYYDYISISLFSILWDKSDGDEFKYNAFEVLSYLAEKHNIEDLKGLSKQIFTITTDELKNEIKTLANKYYDKGTFS